MVKEINKCRICGGALNIILDFGKLYVSTFLKPGDRGVRAPLRVAECSKCRLVQLKDEVELDDMYRQYWYRSGLNKSMTYDLRDIARSAEDIVSLEPGDAVLDIGTNDGTLLKEYYNDQILKVGFDPAFNLKEVAEENCDVFINEYFSSELYPKAGWPKPKVITAIAMFYDLPNPVKFVRDIKELLHNDGVFILQITDWMSILINNMVDSICHEHLEYYKSIDIVALMESVGLEVFDIEKNHVNGGSTRFYVAHNGMKEVNPIVDIVIASENNFFNSTRGSVSYFKNTIALVKDKIKTSLKNYENVYALAASTKGNTLLQVLGLTSADIIAIGEINESKFGLRTPGSNIKIVSEQEVLNAHPELIIVLAWHFTSTFKEVLKDYLLARGKVLYPLPYPFVQTKNGGYLL